MKFRLKHILQLFKSNEGKKKVSLFLVCLLCSFLFWLFIKMSQTSIIEYNYIVKIENLPLDYFVESPVGKSVRVNLSSTGAGFLFSGMFFRPSELSIDFEKFKKIDIGPDKQRFFLTSAAITKLLGNQITSNLEVVKVTPDTLFYYGQRATIKKLPVVLGSTEISFKPGFNKYGNINIEPDSVLVKLTSVEAEKVDYVVTEHFEISQLDVNFYKNVSLMTNTDVIHFEIIPGQATVFIPVEKYTEKVFEVEIKILCNDEIIAPEEYAQLRMIPSKAMVNCKTALKDYTDITPDMFVLVVDCEDFIHEERANKLTVKLHDYPENIIINSVSPVNVDYILLK